MRILQNFVYDNYLNTESKSLIDDLITNFECIKVSKKGYWGNDILHDKFCIIDLEYVMHGSYNWSKSAKSPVMVIERLDF